MKKLKKKIENEKIEKEKIENEKKEKVNYCSNTKSVICKYPYFLAASISIMHDQIHPNH